MHPYQILIVRNSWNQHVRPHTRILSRVLSMQLMLIEPALRGRVAGRDEDYGGRLLSLVGIGVNSLEKPHVLASVLRELGSQRSAIGTLTEHGAAVATALAQTLRIAAGEEYSRELMEAWDEAFALIVGTVLRAAAEGVAPWSSDHAIAA
jgi:nitric oxide dioxygenase